MPTEINKLSANHPKHQPLMKLLEQSLQREKPDVVAIASAFVSVPGLEGVEKIISKFPPNKKRIIVGTCRGISHPAAIQLAVDKGWEVRLGNKPGGGIFHPKLILGGKKFDAAGGLKSPSFCYVGSSNLTMGGLQRNVECGLLSQGSDFSGTASSSWSFLWKDSLAASKRRISEYADLFAKRNRERSLDDLNDLEFDVQGSSGSGPKKKLSGQKAKKRKPSLPLGAATVAWVGLESFTGEYQFQVEFPKDVAEIAKRMINGRRPKKLKVYTPADGLVHEMTYRFYENNGMFRLNIPNDVPGVAKARQTHSGIALVEKYNASSAHLSLQIIPPGVQADQIEYRSSILGTWGSTPTRFYGWY